MYSTNPNLTQLQRTRMTDWMLDVLNSDNLTQSRSNLPTLGMVTLYRDGRGLNVRAGNWQIDTGGVYLAGPSDFVAPSERLEIMATLVGFTDPARHVELEAALATAITKSLLGQYRTMTGAILTANAGNATASRIAFSPDQTSVAAYINDGWFTPQGVPVDVGDGWVVCAL